MIKLLDIGYTNILVIGESTSYLLSVFIGIGPEMRFIGRALAKTVKPALSSIDVIVSKCHRPQCAKNYFLPLKSEHISGWILSSKVPIPPTCGLLFTV